jgi:hypothetical protein
VCTTHLGCDDQSKVIFQVMSILIMDILKVSSEFGF